MAHIVFANGDRIIVDGNADFVATQLTENAGLPVRIVTQEGDRPHIRYVNPAQVAYVEDERASVYEERGIASV